MCARFIRATKQKSFQTSQTKRHHEFGCDLDVESNTCQLQPDYPDTVSHNFSNQMRLWVFWFTFVGIKVGKCGIWTVRNNSAMYLAMLNFCKFSTLYLGMVNCCTSLSGRNRLWKKNEVCCKIQDIPYSLCAKVVGPLHFLKPILCFAE